LTKLLEKAFAEASRLPEGEQDAVAGWLLEEMASERRWAEAFTISEDALCRLADEAVEEWKAGETRELDPRRL
jgi:hypothetical protein